MGRLTGLRVKLVLHSEVGEGKGQVDMKFGQKAQQFVSILGRLSRTCAADLFEHLELCRGGGDYNLELDISLALFKPGTSGALPFLEQCAAVEYVAEGGLRLREIDGCGPGVEVPASKLEELDHYGIMGVEETGSSALHTSEGPMVPQRQDGHDAKRQIVADRRGMQTEKKQQQQAKKKDNAALVAAVEPASRAKTCTACCGVYRSEDTFRRHYTNGACEKKQQKAAGAKSLREERKPAAKLVKERRAAQREADVTSADRSDERQFEFDSSDDGCAISLSDHTGVVIVSKVLHERKLLATYVLPGYTITAVADNDTPVAELRAQALMDLVALSSDARRITVTFAKPPCPMPMRGYARKRFCKETKFKMTETQRRFLTSFLRCSRDDAQSTPFQKSVQGHARNNRRPCTRRIYAEANPHGRDGNIQLAQDSLGCEENCYCARRSGRSDGSGRGGRGGAAKGRRRER